MFDQRIQKLADQLSILDPTTPRDTAIALLRRWVSSEPRDARVTLCERFEIPRSVLPRDHVDTDFRLYCLERWLVAMGIAALFD